MWKPSRPSPAMVVAVAALVVSLVGTGYAASLITGHDIKKNSVNANRLKKKTLTAKQVKKDALRGPQIKESTLRKVRAAGYADLALDAQTIDGLTAKTFVYEAEDGSSGETVLSMGSLTLKASCESGLNNGLTVTARSAVSGATISYSSISQGGAGGVGSGQARNNAYGTMLANNDQMILSPDGATQTTNGSSNVGWSSGSIVYSVPASGEVTSIDWAWNANRGGHDCTWTGTALGGRESQEVLQRVHGEGSSLSELQRASRAR